MNTDGLEWHRTIPEKLMSPNEVHVWRVLLEPPDFKIESLLEFLSADELERAGRFHFDWYVQDLFPSGRLINLQDSPQDLYFYNLYIMDTNSWSKKPSSKTCL